MVLIICIECGREISDRAPICPGCGCPVELSINKNREKNKPTHVTYNPETNTFSGTRDLLIELAIKAILHHHWTLIQVVESLGVITFKTNISWGSWSGVRCSLYMSEVSPFTFHLSGIANQNISGIQAYAFNIGDEAQSKVTKAINTMKKFAIANNNAALLKTQDVNSSVNSLKEIGDYSIRHKFLVDIELTPEEQKKVDAFIEFGFKPGERLVIHKYTRNIDRFDNSEWANVDRYEWIVLIEKKSSKP
jgi:hypothetical protein